MLRPRLPHFDGIDLSSPSGFRFVVLHLDKVL